MGESESKQQRPPAPEPPPKPRPRVPRKPQGPPPAAPLLEKAWKEFSWTENIQLRNAPPPGAAHVRILLYGPVGAGKSSFINNAASAIAKRPVKIAESDAISKEQSFTTIYKTHQIKFSDQTYPVVFNDLMGLEVHNGIQLEDIKLAMKGKLRDGYKFDKSGGKKQTKLYRHTPSVSDRVHVLVCVLNANMTEIDADILEKMKRVRETARDLGIPQLAIVTHIDEICDKIENDITNVFKSKVLKTKFDYYAASLGIPLPYIFPIWNDHLGEQKNEADKLILAAVENMVNFGDDHVHSLNPDSSSGHAAFMFEKNISTKVKIQGK